LAALAAALAVQSSLFCLIPASPAAAQALPGNSGKPADSGQTVDSVAAVVNDDVITERELQMRADLVARRLQQQNAPTPPEDQLKRQVLDQMVLERIQLQKAKEDGITVDDAAVQSTLQRLAQANNMTLDIYRARLEAQGVPWSVFTRDARTELTLSKLREREVDSKISVSDAEVANYIASQRGPGAKAEQDLRIEHILVKVPDGASQDVLAAAQQKAQAILDRAKKDPGHFESLAKDNSQAADAKKGGDLGFVPPARLPAQFVQASSQLRPGQISPELIRTSEGFEIMRLVDRRTGVGGTMGGTKLMQTHVRHILLRVGQGGLSEQEARQKELEIRQQIEAGGDFAKFAQSYSQDGSASQGGDLGWISPGETVPDFERAMNNLKDGEISQPVRSEYGYHLIQVIGRREAEGSIQQQMDLARQAIGQRKAEQAYSDWLRQLRDSAYVEYKIGSSLAQQ
jgi:peptidyl-prolyl cis-trans isomerase SurA